MPEPKGLSGQYKFTKTENQTGFRIIYLMMLKYASLKKTLTLH